MEEFKLSDYLIDCPDCDGKGKVEQKDSSGMVTYSQSCFRCGQKKQILTPAGEQLAKFVQFVSRR